MLTVVAAEGYSLLAQELRSAWEDSCSFLEVGVAYVRFAVKHRAHFEVMFRPELHREDDPDLSRCKQAAAQALYGPAATVQATSAGSDTLTAGVAAWSLAHGLATLWLNRNLPDAIGHDPEVVTRAVARHLFPAQSAE